jgi:acetyl-CoA synthetase
MNSMAKPGDKTGHSAEERVFRPLPGIMIDANLSPREYEEAREAGRDNPRGFWEQAALDLEWYQKWDRVLDDTQAPFYRWFPGARCNIVYNALDRHISTVNKNKLALIWEGEPGDSKKFTYFELYREVNRLANALRALGVGRGDRVVLYMPMLAETVIAMLACAKIGAVHSAVFAGFSAKALRDRISDAQARCVITADGFYRNGRVINLKAGVDQALTHAAAECVETVIVVHRAGVEMEMTPARDIWYEDIVRGEASESPTEVLDANDPLFLLYTSGTTARPKGVVHAHAGYMVGVHQTMKWVFDVKPTDIFWCTADAGWVTGHSYVVYGPLISGTTSVIYEGYPLYPQADRIWHIVAKYGVTILYTTPTLIRMLMRYGTQFPRQHNITSLRLLGTVGEAINPEAWEWFHKNAGRGECPLLDTWWQTETGSIMVSPLPISPLKPGSVGKPLPGVDAEVVDKAGAPVAAGETGNLVLRRPWPSMLATVHNDPERYKRTYWERVPGVFYTGDSAVRDEDGYLWMQGRADEMINIAGHILGTVELERALTSHRSVSNAAVVGVPDKIRGQAAKAYVVVEADAEPGDGLVEELKAHMADELGPVAVIKAIEFRDELPKTRSGKIMRRVLKAEALGLDPGDLSSMEGE